MSAGAFDPAGWITALRTDRQRLAALEGADLTARVPACPKWDLAELLAHLGLVHRMAGRMAATPPGEEVPRATERPPGPQERLEWVLTGLDALVEAFDSADLDQPCRRWAGDTTIGWWLRRQAHETAIHRWDAEVTAGREPSGLDGRFAADGVDEWLELNLVRGIPIPDDLRGSIHLHATDLDDVAAGAEGADDQPALAGEWDIRLDGGLTWEHAHHKGDVALRGSREQLLLACWGRTPLERLEVFGDAGLWERFLAALHGT